MNRIPRRSWTAHAEDALSAGLSITVQPTGNSMQPCIFAGDTVTLEPAREISIGDVVLARVQRRRAVVVLHQVLAAEDARYLIGNANGREDGWVEARDILGKATRIERAST